MDYSNLPAEYIESLKEYSKDKLNDYLNGKWDNTMNEPDNELIVDEKKTVDALNAGAKGVDFKREKYMALYQARHVLSNHGTMQERSICKRQLERMKKLGIESI